MSGGASTTGGATGVSSGVEGGASGADGGAGGAEGGGADLGGASGSKGCEPSKTAEVAYLLDPEPSSSAVRFGTAVALDGDTLVVGALSDEAASVFVKTECGWSFQAQLQAQDKTLGASFGIAVAVRGDTILVGAPAAEVPLSSGDSLKAGAVYVFERTGTRWVQEGKLIAPNPDAYDNFGASVALDVDTIAIGAPGEDSASRTIDSGLDDNTLDGDGAAYVFSRVANAWVEAAYLKREGDGGGNAFGGFGASISASGTRIVVGAPGTDASGFADAGAAYLFNQDSGVWSLEQTIWVRPALTASETNAKFGTAVSLSGETLAVGAPDDSDGTATPFGTVTIFGLFGQGAGWHPITRLGNFGRGNDFGSSVALQGKRLVVGDPLETNGGQGLDPEQGDLSVGVGAAYLFDVNPKTWGWELTHYIKASNARQYDKFGVSVALSGNAFVVGAPLRHSAPEEFYSPSDKYRYGPGAAYAYEIVP
ncbi:MAG TPA: hypothetical protein VHB79_36055 [Polyangiaceae bacterium]|nr:hypothetical protein [Polyangiaceae bacterium]